MSDSPAPVRSYQRIFCPDRRVYSIDGRTLPVPGGVPLRWLAAALGALVAVVALAAAAPVVMLGVGSVVAGVTVMLGRRRLAPAAFVLGVLVCMVAGVVLRALDWPLRLFVVPALVATVATQVTPDGRAAHRYAWSWLAVRAAGRRSLGNPLPSVQTGGVRVRVAHDEHAAALGRARFRGPVTVEFRDPVFVRTSGRKRAVRPAGRGRNHGLLLDRVAVGDRERVVIRP